MRMRDLGAEERTRCAPTVRAAASRDMPLEHIWKRSADHPLIRARFARSAEIGEVGCRGRKRCVVAWTRKPE